MNWLLDSTNFEPFREANAWSAEMRHIWIVSNFSIAVCCFGLAIALALVWHKRRNTVTSRLVLLCFGLFLLSLGLTFALSIVTLYTAPYHLVVLIRAITAVFAFVVAAKMPFVLVDVLKLPSRELMHQLNNRLNSELLQKKIAEVHLRERNRDLIHKILTIEQVVENQEWFHQKTDTVQQLREMLLSVGGPNNGT